jgi:hypothetical protein
MREIDNPFSPGAGSPPPELAGRSELLESARILIQRAGKGKSVQSMILLGLRGVGKTVLLNRIEQIAIGLGENTFMLEVDPTKRFSESLAGEIQRLLYRLDSKSKLEKDVRQAFQTLQLFVSSFKVSVGEIDLSMSPGQATGNLSTDLTDLLVSVGSAAKNRKRTIVFLIDEIHLLSKDDLTAVIVALHKVSQKQLPIVMFGAGLPQMAKLAGSSKTHIERLFRFPQIGKLTEEDSRKALLVPVEDSGVSFEESALQHIYKETEGYPYYLQIWGSHCWAEAAGSLITIGNAEAASKLAWAELDRTVFQRRVERLSDRHLRYVLAMASIGKEICGSKEIAARTGLKTSEAAPIRKEIMDKDIAYSPERGKLAFSIPLFNRYLQRTFSEEIKEIK